MPDLVTKTVQVKCAGQGRAQEFCLRRNSQVDMVLAVIEQARAAGRAGDGGYLDGFRQVEAKLLNGHRARSLHRSRDGAGVGVADSGGRHLHVR